MAKRLALPAEFTPSMLTVLQDQQEKQPFNFANFGFEIRVLHLKTGDYSYVGGEFLLRIERKSLPDLVGCAGGERARFEAELERLLAYRCAIVLVECAWSDLEVGAWRSQLTPKQLIGSIYGWMEMGIQFHFPGNRGAAEAAAAKLLFVSARRRWLELRGMVGTLDEPKPRLSPNAHDPVTINSFCLPAEGS